MSSIVTRTEAPAGTLTPNMSKSQRPPSRPCTVTGAVLTTTMLGSEKSSLGSTSTPLSPSSERQSPSQPSPAARLWSSHDSPCSLTPSPQAACTTVAGRARRPSRRCRGRRNGQTRGRGSRCARRVRRRTRRGRGCTRGRRMTAGGRSRGCACGRACGRENARASPASMWTRKKPSLPGSWRPGARREVAQVVGEARGVERVVEVHAGDDGTAAEHRSESVSDCTVASAPASARRYSDSSKTLHAVVEIAQRSSAARRFSFSVAGRGWSRGSERSEPMGLPRLQMRDGDDARRRQRRASA